MTVHHLDSLPDHPADPLFAFLAEQCRDKADPTVQRYEQTIASLMEFMEDVDVEPIYGPEIATHLLDRREALVSHAFLPTLGYAGLVRALPLFLADPWLPPAGMQRSTHRSLVERLLVFLRRQGLIDAAALKSDLRAARRAIGTARSRDFGWGASVDPIVSDETTVVSLDLELPTRVLDDLLATLEREDGVRTLADHVVEMLTPSTSEELDRRYGRDPWPNW